MTVDKIPFLEAGIKSLKKLDRRSLNSELVKTVLDGMNVVVKKCESTANTTKGTCLLGSLQEPNNAIAIDLKNDTAI